MTRADYACDLQRTAAHFAERARERYDAQSVDRTSTHLAKQRDAVATIRTQRVAAQAYAEARAVLGIEVAS